MAKIDRKLSYDVQKYHQADPTDKNSPRPLHFSIALFGPKPRDKLAEHQEIEENDNIGQRFDFQWCHPGKIH